MTKEKTYFEYRDGNYYFKILNNKIISEKNWEKLLKLIEELKKEQKGK